MKAGLTFKNIEQHYFRTHLFLRHSHKGNGRLDASTPTFYQPYDSRTAWYSGDDGGCVCGDPINLGAGADVRRIPRSPAHLIEYRIHPRLLHFY